jgi:hypothetical protein
MGGDINYMLTKFGVFPLKTGFLQVCPYYLKHLSIMTRAQIQRIAQHKQEIGASVMHTTITFRSLVMSITCPIRSCQLLTVKRKASELNISCQVLHCNRIRTTNHEYRKTWNNVPNGMVLVGNNENFRQ